MIHITDTNPNPHDVTLCGTEDCHGPYVVFSAYELDDPMNPHPVICSHHLEADITPMVEQWEAENYIDVDSEEVETPVEEREEEVISI